jgi:hypothetical protein
MCRRKNAMLSKKDKINWWIVVLVSYSMMFLGFALQHNKNLYPETAKIIELQETETGYVITFETGNGNTFLYESEDRDFYENEIYSILMNSRNTKSVKDDVIVKIKYAMSE